MNICLLFTLSPVCGKGRTGVWAQADTRLDPRATAQLEVGRAGEDPCRGHQPPFAYRTTLDSSNNPVNSQAVHPHLPDEDREDG